MTCSTPHKDLVQALQTMMAYGDTNPPHSFTLNTDQSAAIKSTIELLEIWDGEMCFKLDGKIYRLMLEEVKEEEN